MKKIILVRHAKSSWEFNLEDYERPLSERGFNDASLVSKELCNYKFQLDLLISSGALRAKTTADIFISNLEIDKNICNVNHSLYDFSGQDLLQTIKSTNILVNNLMLFGHNHAITAFVNTYGNIFIENVPTCGVVILEFDIINWNEIKKGNTLKTIFPRDLK